MEQYQVKTGENIFDIAITLSGTIEGIWDLLVCNDWLSMDTELQRGMVLNYHPEFVVNSNVVKWLGNNDIMVKNGHHYNEDIDISTYIYKTMVQKFESILASEINDVQNYADADDAETGAEEEIEVWQSNPTGFKRTSILSDLANFKSDAIQTDALNADEVPASSINITKDMLVKRIPEASSSISGQKLNDVAQVYFNATGISSQESSSENVDEKNSHFWDSVCQPKMLVDHYGTYSCISLKMREDGFVVVDWGDSSGFQAYWGTGETDYIEHDFEDVGRHIIKVYGLMDIQDLDLSELNGVYYMISPIYVSGEFVGNSAANDAVNGLLLTKESNEQVN